MTTAAPNVWERPRADGEVDVFAGFIRRHWRRFRDDRLPDPHQPDNEPHYDDWREQWIEAGITLEDAQVASDRLARRHPKAWEHRAAFIAAAVEAKRARDERPAAEMVRTSIEDRAAFAAAKRRWDSLTEGQRDTRKRLVSAGFPEGFARRFPGLVEAAAIRSLMPAPAREVAS